MHMRSCRWIVVQADRHTHIPPLGLAVYGPLAAQLGGAQVYAGAALVVGDGGGVWKVGGGGRVEREMRLCRASPGTRSHYADHGYVS